MLKELMAKTDFRMTVLSIGNRYGGEKKKKKKKGKFSAYQKQAAINHFNKMGQTISELTFTRPFHRESLKLTVIKKKKI